MAHFLHFFVSQLLIVLGYCGVYLIGMLVIRSVEGLVGVSIAPAGVQRRGSAAGLPLLALPLQGPGAAVHHGDGCMAQSRRADARSPPILVVAWAAGLLVMLTAGTR